jgi:hypothetical protein
MEMHSVVEKHGKGAANTSRSGKRCFVSQHDKKVGPDGEDRARGVGDNNGSAVEKLVGLGLCTWV